MNIIETAFKYPDSQSDSNQSSSLKSCLYKGGRSFRELVNLQSYLEDH